MSHPWKKRALASVLCLSMFAGGCYGPFNLTRQVHDWNGTVSENEWAQEGIFLGLSIILVYPFAALGDALIFNSMEFWGWENPVGPPSSATSMLDDSTPVDGALAMR